MREMELESWPSSNATAFFFLGFKFLAFPAFLVELRSLLCLIDQHCFSSSNEVSVFLQTSGRVTCQRQPEGQ